MTHWTWVKSVTLRFLGKTSRQARLCYLLDAGVLLGLAVITVTGLAISTWLELPLSDYPVWKDLHVTASIVTLLLIVGKLGLHWRWIVRIAKQGLFGAAAPVAKERVLQPAPVSAGVSRREFLSLLGVVGLASTAAVVNVWDSGTPAQASPAVAGQLPARSLAQSLSQPSSPQSSAAAPTSPTACVVRCDRRCSCPGKCRRYVDSNGNRLCDLGECL